MSLPASPTNYAAVVDLPTFFTLSWVNGAGAVSVRHELSIDGGATWSRLDDDQVPTVTSDHSLPEDSTVLLRAKSVNADGSSDYTPVIEVQTGNYN